MTDRMLSGEHDILLQTTVGWIAMKLGKGMYYKWTDCIIPGKRIEITLRSFC